MSKQIMHLDCALTRGDMEKMRLSLDDERDTSASWKHVVRRSKTGIEVHFFFYGKKNEDWAFKVQWQTITAINDGSFSEWFS